MVDTEYKLWDDEEQVCPLAPPAVLYRGGGGDTKGGSSHSVCFCPPSFCGISFTARDRPGWRARHINPRSVFLPLQNDSSFFVTTDLKKDHRDG